MSRSSCLPRLRYLCAALALAFTGAAHGGATLFNYGATAGDKKLAPNDDSFLFNSFSGLGPAGSSASMSLYGATYNGIYVDNNGLLSFGAGIASFTPDNFPSSTKTPALAAFWADVDTRTGIGTGSVWYRTTQDAQQLTALKTLLSKSFLGNQLAYFNPTYAEVVTWDHVGGYGLKTTQTNTFQEIVVSDSMQTYAIYLYPDNGIQWMVGTASSGANPNVGFDMADGKNFYNMIGSGTAAMKNLASLTNTVPANPGVQVYRVDGNGAVVGGSAGGASPTILPSHTWVASGGGSWSSAANWSALSGADASARSVSANTWVNGDAAIFSGSGGTINIDSAIATPRLTVNSSGYTFTSSSAANSLQLDSLTLPDAGTSVNFGGNLVVLTHAGQGSVISDGQQYVQQGALTRGQLNFTDNSVLAARDAGMVDGANLHLLKSAQVQLYTAGAITRNTTLRFDSSAGGVGGTLDLRGLSTSMGAVSSTGTAAGRIVSSTNGGSLTVDFDQAQATFNGSISGALSLTKAGSGSWTLSGANSYTGATHVAGGALLVDGTASASAFTVDAGAVLGGHGTVGKVTMAGTLSPGNSPGTLNTGDFTFAAGSSYLWQINDGAGGAGADLLLVNGALTFSGPTTVRLQSLLGDGTAGDVFNFDAHQDHSYTIASATAGIIGGADLLLDASGFTNALYGGSWSLAVQNNQLALNFTAGLPSAVPEPGQYGMLLAGLALAGYAARRRRKQA